jgi:beta-glucosidase
MTTIARAVCTLFCALTAVPVAHAGGLSPAAAEAKAREVERKMTDEERFGLIKNLMVVNFRTMQRDERVPAHIQQMAGWTPGVPRLYLIW